MMHIVILAEAVRMVAAQHVPLMSRAMLGRSTSWGNVCTCDTATRLASLVASVLHGWQI